MIHNFSRERTFIYIVCGIVISFLLFIYPASIFVITIVIIISYFLYKKVGDSEKNFILSIFFSGLFLRLFFAIVTHILAVHYGLGPKAREFPGMEGGAIIGDDIGIHQRAWILSEMVKGVQLSNHQKEILLYNYGWGFQNYLLGFFYYLFGIVPFLGKCINSLFGVLNGIIVYFISKELFNIRTAKLASILTVFYPTTFLWSLANLKDTIFIFLLIFAMYSYILFLKIKGMRYLLLFVSALFLINEYRGNIIFSLIFASVISLIVNIKWNYKKAMVSVVIIFILLNSNIIYSYCMSNLKPHLKGIEVNKLIEQQKGHVSSKGSIYKIYPERFYKYKDAEPISMAEFMISLNKGVISLMFKPFPWEIDNAPKLFFYPVSIIWNLLSPFFIIGLFVVLRYRIKYNVFLISTFVIIVIALSLTEGNIGTMIRHRDMIMPIYIIFCATGMVRLLYPLDYEKV